MKVACRFEEEPESYPSFTLDTFSSSFVCNFLHLNENSGVMQVNLYGIEYELLVTNTPETYKDGR